ncbi:glycosyltransferase family 1 protein [Rhodohalobacter sp. SW132]|uniref:glycosyltransferase family 4 protein n=1 Tax=Rhodohalobacter sp. SW132 TaxID=2293433 RepID=UPI000E23AD04|nr:glycosyltransferase family 4 protein [Rhodohalobacter sp. SW132]REL24735.1 glycosyltransferase family 1 protein [Rhodohalobacter sp. SW132]
MINESSLNSKNDSKNSINLVINAGSIFKGGAEQVVLSFIHECKKWSENEYHILLRDNIKSQLNTSDFPSNFIFYDVEQRPGSGLVRYMKEMRRFNRLENKIRPDCVISTGGHGYWRSSAPLVVGFNIPHFIYPESPYFKRLSIFRRIFWEMKKKIHFYFYGRSDAMVVQTDDVNKRLKSRFPKIPIYTVSNTVNSCFRNPEFFPEKLPKNKEGEIRLLTLSSWYAHKNIGVIRNLIEIYKKKGINHIKFVLTLPKDIFEREFPANYRDMIYNIGPVPINECPSLYKECDFMFLPTLLECFSASYAEAMMMEKPILTSDLGFAHTVCGEAAQYFDPVDPEDIFLKIDELVHDPEKQEKLIQTGKERLNQFNTSTERASEFISICKKLASSGR